MPTLLWEVNGRELSRPATVITAMEWSDLYGHWSDLVRIVVIGFFAYFGVIFLLRATGKRTLSQMNVFDFIVTVALGSIMATLLLSKSTSLAAGMTAFAVLIALQYVVAWGTTRSKWLLNLVKAEPTLLVSHGEMLDNAMKRERVAREEVLAAIREAGEADLANVRALVLETDGTFSVIRNTAEDTETSTLTAVSNPKARFR